MITLTCIEKFKKNNKIYGYRVQDQQGNTRDVTPEQLKVAILNQQVTITNLTLTSDGRLVDSSQLDKSKDNTDEKLMEEYNRLKGEYDKLKGEYDRLKKAYSRIIKITDKEHDIHKKILRDMRYGEGSTFFAHTESGTTMLGKQVAFFGDEDTYKAVKNNLISQGFDIEQVPTNYYKHELAYEKVVWEADEKVNKFNKEKTILEGYIEDAKSNGNTSIYFTYIEGNSAYYCGDRELYTQLKAHFQSRGYKIEKIPAKFNATNGGLAEYAKEVISWA